MERDDSSWQKAKSRTDSIVKTVLGQRVVSIDIEVNFTIIEVKSNVWYTMELKVEVCQNTFPLSLLVARLGGASN